MKNKSSDYRTSLPFELLKTFTEKELNCFEKLLASGCLNTTKGLDVLLKSFKKHALHHADFTPVIQSSIYYDFFHKEKAVKVLNANQKKKLSKAINELLNAAEKFLMLEEIKDTDEYDALLLYPTLINRKQLLLYNRRLNATDKKLNNEKKQGLKHHTKKLNIQCEKYKLLFMNNSLSKEDNFDELQYHLDVKYILQKLQYHLAKITLQRRYAHKTFDVQPYVALQALLNLPNYQSNPLIKLYILNIELVEKEEEATFLALSKLLKEKQENIPANFLSPFYTNITNYCISRVASGNLDYFNYLFEIYNNMHQAGLFVLNNTVDPSQLKNIITNACRVKEFDWAVDKLNYYTKFLPKIIKNDVFEYNAAIIAFNQNKYDAALLHFNKVKKIDDTHELSLRITQLQCFYEIDDLFENSTQQLIKTLRTYVKQNKKLAAKIKPAYFSFIHIFRWLYKLKNVFDKSKQKIVAKKNLPKIKALLLASDSIIAKQWLLDKMEELEQMV